MAYNSPPWAKYIGVPFLQTIGSKKYKAWAKMTDACFKLYEKDGVTSIFEIDPSLYVILCGKIKIKLWPKKWEIQSPHVKKKSIKPEQLAEYIDYHLSI